MRIGIIEEGKNRFLVWHGDAETVDRNLAHTGKQIFECFGVQRQVDRIDVLAAKGRIHDGGRKRVDNRVSGNAIDASGGVHLFDAVDAAQLLRGDLSGSGFFPRTHGGEGEYAAGTDSQHAADDSLFAHADADDGMVVAFATQELDHGNIVGERGSSADYFVEVGGKLAHLLQSLVEPLGGPEVVKGEN